jgi:hypothetical protein
MTDLLSQAQALMNLYWEDILFAIGVAGVLVIRRELKNARQKQLQPAVVPSATPSSDITSVPPDGDSIGAVLLAASAATGAQISPLTLAEDAELENAVPSSLPMPAPTALPATVPAQVSTQADTQVSTKAQNPTTPDEKPTTARALRLLLGGSF